MRSVLFFLLFLTVIEPLYAQLFGNHYLIYKKNTEDGLAEIVGAIDRSSSKKDTEEKPIYIYVLPKEDRMAEDQYRVVDHVLDESNKKGLSENSNGDVKPDALTSPVFDEPDLKVANIEMSLDLLQSYDLSVSSKIAIKRLKSRAGFCVTTNLLWFNEQFRRNPFHINFYDHENSRSFLFLSARQIKVNGQPPFNLVFPFPYFYFLDKTDVEILDESRDQVALFFKYSLPVVTVVNIAESGNNEIVFDFIDQRNKKGKVVHSLDGNWCNKVELAWFGNIVFERVNKGNANLEKIKERVGQDWMVWHESTCKGGVKKQPPKTRLDASVEVVKKKNSGKKLKLIPFLKAKLASSDPSIRWVGGESQTFEIIDVETLGN